MGLILQAPLSPFAGMERAHLIGDVTGADQKIPDFKGHVPGES